MLHLRDTSETPWPAQIDRFEWELPADTTGPQILYLDSLSMYQEVVGRIPQWIDYVRPYGYAPAFAPVRNNSVQLDFPTNAHAFRPRTSPERFVTKAERQADQVFRFIYESTEGTLTYEISAIQGFPVVSAWTGGEAGATKVQWKGVRVISGDVDSELRYARLRDGILWLQYSDGLSFEYQLNGRTLQLDTHSLSEAVTRFDLGRFSVAGRKLPGVLTLPFFRLSERTRWPVFTWQDQGKTLLGSCFPDWWYSMSGRYVENAQESPAAGLGLGFMEYPVRWRGSRNIFRERVYFTVGSKMMDVLPSVAHPKAMYREELTHRIWMDDKADGLEGAPTVVPPGEKDIMNALQGQVTSLLQINPRDEVWDEGLVARTSTGEWLKHPAGNFVIKSGRLDGVDVFERVGQEDPGAFVYETDVFSYPPWRFVDNDVRLPGAGTYAQGWAETGAFLQQVAAETGVPVLGMGGSALFWGGLVAGVVPEFPLGIEELHPFLPHMAWQVLHPVTVLLGVGTVQDFGLPGEDDPPESVLVERMLATQIAYGAMGRLPVIQDETSRLKALRLQEVLQPRINSLSAERIAYWDGQRFVDVAEALQSNVLAESRLYIRLTDATEIWVNGSFDQPWQVRVDAETLRLPPFGYVVRGSDFFAVNARTEDGKPYCILEAPESTWIHSLSRPITRSGFTVQGCVQIQRPQKDSPMTVIHIQDWFGRIEFNKDQLGLDAVGTVIAKDAEAQVVTDATLKQSNGVWTLESDQSIRTVEIYPTVRGIENNFVP
jgi:hypothetical protein